MKQTINIPGGQKKPYEAPAMTCCELQLISQLLQSSVKTDADWGIGYDGAGDGGEYGD